MRRDAAAIRSYGWIAPAGRVSPETGKLPVWARRIQNGLGAAGANSMESRGMHEGRRGALGGTLDEIVASERAPAESRVSDRPFLLVVQPSLFDASRAPVGQHTAWAYCHVPNEEIEAPAVR